MKEAGQFRPLRSMARPKKKIDEEQVFRLAQLQCTFVEIAAFFDCDAGTISNRFSDVVAKGREVGKMSLRRSQFKLAEKMLQWQSGLANSTSDNVNQKRKSLLVLGKYPMLTI